jgi:hypothetical protein
MFSKTSDPCDAFERLHKHEASLARQHRAALRDLQTSKEDRSKIMTGKNPAALSDIAQVVEEVKAVLHSQGIPFSGASNSNPIPAATPSSQDTVAAIEGRSRVVGEADQVVAASEEASN